MTPHQIVVVGLRLVAILWLVHVVAQLPLIFAQSTINPDASDAPLVGVVGFIQIAFCAILWFFPASIARKLLPSPNNDVVHANPPASQDWLTLGSILIGL